ncbi:MAG: V-type ATP synthase subunit E family protein [Gemmatimonadales bacterium]|jgi:V/A-type H+-transporting ATPase subunit E
MTEPDVTPSGVQALIDRIRDEGVQSALEEAARILTEARAQAARIVSDAKAEAAAMKKDAKAAIATEREAAIEALMMAARDTELELRTAVLAAFEEHVRGLVTDVTAETSMLRDMILVLAGRAAEDFIKDRDAKILVPRHLADEAPPELEEFLRRSALAVSADVLRDGIELIPSSKVRGGARVRLVDEELEIDLTDEALSEMMLTLLLPRYRRILAEAGQ